MPKANSLVDPEDHPPVKLVSQTYSFQCDHSEDTMSSKSKLWQIVPCTCASLICLPFGLMLGWPSTSYPRLLSESQVFEPQNNITISMDQSAMITGFLMLGSSAGAPLAPNRLLPAKYALVLGAAFSTFGWLIMWQASNIYFLLASRFIIGLSHSYSSGQLKRYISEISEPTVGKFFVLNTPFFTTLGSALMFVYAPFVNFTQLCIVALIITVFILFFLLFLPSTPRELILANRVADAIKLLKFLKPNIDITSELTRIRSKNIQEKIQWGNLRQTNILIRFAMFTLLVFIQQTTGLPSFIAYAQLILTNKAWSNPQFIAIGYILVHVLATTTINFTISHKQRALLISMILTTISLLLMTLDDYFSGFTTYFFPVMLFVNCAVNTSGLALITPHLINEFFPKHHVKLAGIYFTITNTLFALIATKTFQVFFTQFAFYVALMYFLVVALCGCAYVTFLTLYFRKNDQVNCKSEHVNTT